MVDLIIVKLKIFVIEVDGLGEVLVVFKVNKGWIEYIGNICKFEK